jgi:hypothetical protein
LPTFLPVYLEPQRQTMTTIIPMFPPAASGNCSPTGQLSPPASASVLLFDRQVDDGDFEAVPESADVQAFCRDARDAARKIDDSQVVTAAALLAMSQDVMVRFVTGSDLADCINLHGHLAYRVRILEGLSAIFEEAKRRLAIAIEAAQIGGAS